MDYHLKFGILLSLLAGISFCAHSSKLGSHKYITKAYFDKHNTIIDQSFQDFIATNLPHGSCKIIQPNHNYFPNLSLLGRKLTGEGSHRRLISSIKIKNHQEMSSLSCEAIIIERLPSGVFADPFELQHLTQRGVFGDASAFGDTDLELPTVRANRSVVEIHMDLSPKNNRELKIELPLHARYAPLGEIGGYKRIEFGAPDLFVRCNIERGPRNDSCIYSSTNEYGDEFRASILWEVPSGIVEHTKVVSMLTFISAIVSAFSISIACIYYSNTTFKQS